MTRILLWGDTQTGKTSLVASAFHAEAGRPHGIDHIRSEAEVQRVLWQNWESLRLGRHVGATAFDTPPIHIHVNLVDDRGERVVIEDIPGGMVRDIPKEDVQQRLASADAYLVFVEWESRHCARQFNAVLGAREILRGKPSALVFTKCDRRLSFDDPLWRRRGPWWQDVPWLRDPVIQQAIDPFDGSVWLSSAVGYHDHSGEPAVLLGEFGDLIPWNVHPRGVVEPFEYLLTTLRGTGGRSA